MDTFKHKNKYVQKSKCLILNSTANEKIPNQFAVKSQTIVGGMKLEKQHTYGYFF